MIALTLTAAAPWRVDAQQTGYRPDPDQIDSALSPNTRSGPCPGDDAEAGRCGPTPYAPRPTEPPPPGKIWVDIVVKVLPRKADGRRWDWSWGWYDPRTMLSTLAPDISICWAQGRDLKTTGRLTCTPLREQGIGYCYNAYECRFENVALRPNAGVRLRIEDLDRFVDRLGDMSTDLIGDGVCVFEQRDGPCVIGRADVTFEPHGGVVPPIGWDRTAWSAPAPNASTLPNGLTPRKALMHEGECPAYLTAFAAQNRAGLWARMANPPFVETPDAGALGEAGRQAAESFDGRRYGEVLQRYWGRLAGIAVGAAEALRPLWFGLIEAPAMNSVNSFGAKPQDWTPEMWAAMFAEIRSGERLAGPGLEAVRNNLRRCIGE